MDTSVAIPVVANARTSPFSHSAYLPDMGDNAEREGAEALGLRDIVLQKSHA
jgi:hypothetical protein